MLGRFLSQVASSFEAAEREAKVDSPPEPGRCRELFWFTRSQVVVSLLIFFWMRSEPIFNSEKTGIFQFSIVLSPLGEETSLSPVPISSVASLPF